MTYQKKCGANNNITQFCHTNLGIPKDIQMGVQVAGVALFLSLTGCNQESQVANASVNAPVSSTNNSENNISNNTITDTQQVSKKSKDTQDDNQAKISESNAQSNNNPVETQSTSKTQALQVKNAKASADPQESVSPVDGVLTHTEQLLTSANTLANINNSHLNFPIKSELRSNVSQQFLGVNDIEQRLMEALPEIEYHTEQLSEFASQVNDATWHKGQPLNPALIVKIQALLNWHNHGVGAVDGKFSANTIKALQTFQKARGIKPTKSMNEITWKLLTADESLLQRPVLVKYTLNKQDVSIPYPRRSQYGSIREAVAEKFHMSRAMLYRLNPNTRLKAGNTITVYNPGQPNSISVNRVEVYKKKNLLVAYDSNDRIIASYPTTVGYNSPSGSYHVASRVLKPYYNSDFSNKAGTIPPGPNNPVGLVLLGLSKPSFGIHGSPQPEMISRQRSHGCIRLTNWDALSLYGSIKHRAKVQFKNS